MTTLATSLREQVEADRGKAETAYRNLVAASLKGVPSLAKIRHTLEAAGRSVEAFEQDIETLRQRHAAVEDIETAESLGDAISKASAVASDAIKAVNELRERQKKELQEATARQWKLMYETNELQDRQRRLHHEARARLQGTADLAIAEEIEQKQIEILAAERTLHPVMFHLTDLEQRRAQQIEQHQMTYGDSVPVPEPNRSFKHYTAERERLEKTIKEARQRIDTLEAMKLDPVNQRWSGVQS